MNISETRGSRAERGLLGRVKMSRHRAEATWEPCSERSLRWGWNGPGGCGVFGGGRSVSVMSGALSLQELQPPAPQPTGQRAPLQSSHYSADCTQPKIASREEEEGETEMCQ